MTEKDLLLKQCDPQGCHALCCYDGVYLMDGEEALIKTIIELLPDWFKQLPKDYIIMGEWRDGTKGLKTAIRPYNYPYKIRPRHFTPTRCVFCDDNHYCTLETLANALNIHKWFLKPTACWLFPLRIVDGEAAPPPLPGESDPDYIDDDYPGYASYTPCGHHDPFGIPWRTALSEEIDYFKKVGIQSKKEFIKKKHEIATLLNNYRD